MKIFRHFIAFCAGLAAISACEVQFDLNGLDGDPLFILDGNIKIDRMNPEYGSLSMYVYAVPPAYGDRTFSEEARCTLKVYRNGDLLDTMDYITLEPFFGLVTGSYPGIMPGDEITLTAESEGFPTASVTTVMPQDPPAVELSATNTDGTIGISLSFKDDASTSDAYAFRFESLVSDHKPGKDEYGNTLDLPLPGNSVFPFMGKNPFDISWEDGVMYYGLLDDSFNGETKEIGINLPEDILPDSDTAYIRAEIQHISPERLRYQIACQDQSTNIIGIIGMAPVTFAYTNVTGGSGCFSSQNVDYTDWIAIPKAN